MSESAAATIAAGPAPWLQFICEVCGLIYDEALGDPDSGLPAGTRFADIPADWACPICGVGKSDFAPYTPPAAATARPRSASDTNTPTPRMARGNRRDAGVLIVGAGRAGWQVAQALRERDATLPITVVCACAGDVYDKPQLSVAVARGIDVNALVRETAAAAAQRLNVRLLPHTDAVHIDTATRTLRSTRGTLRWRQLVLAHGAEPAVPAVLPKALVWRVNDLAAYTKLRAALAGGQESGPQRVAIIGAGLVGCELANDLALAGHRITLLDVQSRPLPAAIPAVAGERLLAAWAGLPIRFWGGVQVTGVEKLADGSLRIRTLGGGVHEADQVIAATGLRTASRLARSAGLAFDSAAGGITVNGKTGATSQPGIYALGDCAVVDGQASRYIEPIARQARAIALAIVGAGSGQAVLEAATARTTGPPPTLRVKTSSLPITLTATAAGVGNPTGHWHLDADIDGDGAQALQMRRLAADGTLLATLVASTVARQAPGLPLS